jgi:hypothetical protein
MEFSGDRGVCCDGHVNVVRQAGPRNVWMCSARPCLPSPTRAWICASVFPKYGLCEHRQAKPSVSTCLGAPRRLFTSHQGCSGAEAGLTAGEGVDARGQARQLSGERGLRSRCTVVRSAPALGKDKECLERCQASGREVRIVHHRESQYRAFHPGGPTRFSGYLAAHVCDGFPRSAPVVISVGV